MAERGDQHVVPRWAKVSGIIAAVLVLLLLAVLIFGGGQHGPGRHGGSPGDRDYGADHAPPEGGEHGGGHRGSEQARGPVMWTVEVQDDDFAPDELMIQVGDTVEWLHVGSDPHTVTADDDGFDSHPDCGTIVDGALGVCMDEGDTYERTFEHIGDVAYHCKLHEAMEASIEVLERHDPTPEGGHH